MRKNFSKLGFTLIETLIVVAIAGLIAAFTSPFLGPVQDERQLDSSLDLIIEALDDAQDKAVNADFDSNFGVYFESDRFVVFRGDLYDPNDEYNLETVLPPTISIYDIDLLGSGNMVVFQKFTGTTGNTGMLKVRVTDIGTKWRSVCVNSQGVVDYGIAEDCVPAEDYPPSDFSLLSPINGENFLITTPALDWSDSHDPGGSVTYTLWIDDDWDFSSLLVEKSGLTSSGYQIVEGDGLENNSVYYWRVKAVDSQGNETWALQPDWRFLINVDNPAPTGFDLISPADGAVIETTTPSLDWESSIDPEGEDITYTLWIDDDDDFSSLLVERGGLVSSDYDVAAGDGLAGGNTYYWKVKAEDEIGNITWSNQLDWDFRINVEPSDFNLLMPVDDAVVPNTTPELDWEDASDPGDTFTYTLWIDSDPNFGSPLEITDLASSTYTVTAGDNLQMNTVYYWKVKAVDSSGKVKWSNQLDWNFEVNSAPGSFFLNSPENGAVLDTKTPLFAWSNATDLGDTITYTLWIDDDPNFGSLNLERSGLASSQYSAVLADGLQTYITYYWKVKAVDSAGNITWSNQTWNFRIEITEDPNPFNLLSPADDAVLDTTTPALDWETATDPNGDDITYTLWIDDDPAFGSLLVEKTGLDPSNYTVLAGDGLSAGIYYWRVQAVDSKGNSTWANQLDWNFMINLPPAPDGFSLLSPSDGSTLGNLTPALDWEDAEDPGDTVTYTLYMDDDPGFGSSITKSGLASSNYNVLSGDGLQDNTTYYWKVLATDSVGNEVWSDETWSFDTDSVPAGFSLLEPDDGLSIDCETSSQVSEYALWGNSQTQNDTIKVSGGRHHIDGKVHSNNDIKIDGNDHIYDGTVEYVSSIQVNGSGHTFAETPSQSTVQSFPVSWSLEDFNNPGIEGSYAAIAQAEGKYYTHSGTWSISGSGEIVPSGLHYVSGDVNISGSGIQAANVTIVATGKISVSGSNSHFTPYISGLTLFSNRTTTTQDAILISGSGSFGGTCFAPNGLISLTGSDDIIYGSFIGNSVHVVSTDVVISVDIPVVPNTCANDVYFDWEDSVTPGDPNVTYTIIIDDDANFSSPYIQKTGLSSSEYTRDLTDFHRDTYYWKVKAIDTNGNEKWSDQTDWSFFVNINEPPTLFNLLSPADGEIVYSVTPNFDWEDSSDPGDTFTYTLWIDDDPNFGSPIERAGLTQSSYSAVIGDGLSAGIYYWKVKARDSAGHEMWSDQEDWSFTVEAAWYVDASQPSSGNGRSWETAFKTIGEAVSSMSGGDTVLIANGTYTEQINLTSSHSGSAGNHTVFQNKTGDNAVILSWPGSSYAVRLNNSDYVDMKGIKITAARYGINIYNNSSNNMFEDIEVYGNSYHGVYFSSNDCDSNEIKDSIVRNNSRYGIYLQGSNNLVDGSSVYSNGYDGIYAYYAASSVIYNNSIYLNLKDGIYNNNGSNVDIHHNQIYDNMIEGIYATYPNGHHIYNNTLYSNDQSGIYLYKTTAGTVRIRNNLITNNKYGFRVKNGSSNINNDYNDVWGNSTDYNNQGSTYAGLNSLSANPLYVNGPAYNFNLQAASVCINAGDPDVQYNDSDGTRNDIGALATTQ